MEAINYCWNQILSHILTILGDPGAVSGDEGKSKLRGENRRRKLKRKRGAQAWGKSLSIPGRNGSLNAGSRLGRKHSCCVSAKLHFTLHQRAKTSQEIISDFRKKEMSRSTKLNKNARIVGKFQLAKKNRKKKRN